MSAEVDITGYQFLNLDDSNRAQAISVSLREPTFSKHLEAMRNEVVEFCKLGTLPEETRAPLELLKQFEQRCRNIVPPVSDEEARVSSSV